MSGANVETLRRGYDALNSGDLSVVLALDPDIEWHEPAPSPDAGKHRGRDSFERFRRSWLESVDSFRVEPEQVVERDDDLVAGVRQTGTGRASGLRVEARLAHVWTVANGRAVRCEAISDAEAALADGS
jgi:ketosteroid isomerase-like protein